MAKKNSSRNWNDFLDKAVNILLEDPIKSRLTLKYNNIKNVAIIKVTDDKKVILYKCNKEEDFEKIEQIVNVASRLLANLPELEPESTIMEEEKEIDTQDKKKDKKKKNKKRA